MLSDSGRLLPVLSLLWLWPAAVLQVEYETLPGWKSDISKCQTWDELPENAKR